MNIQYLTIFFVIKSAFSYTKLGLQTSTVSNLKPRIPDNIKPARYQTANFKYNPASIPNVTYEYFPDVEYPTNILDSTQPFYLNSDGCNVNLNAFTDDVKSSFKTLNRGKNVGNASNNRSPSIRPLIQKEATKVIVYNINNNNEIKPEEHQKIGNEINTREPDPNDVIVGNISDSSFNNCDDGSDYDKRILINISNVCSDNVSSEETFEFIDIFHYDINDTSILCDEFTLDFNSYETTNSTQSTEETASDDYKYDIESIQAYVDNFFNNKLFNVTESKSQYFSNNDTDGEQYFQENMTSDEKIPVTAPELIKPKSFIINETDSNVLTDDVYFEKSNETLYNN